MAEETKVIEGPKLTEEQTTEAYIEQRKEGKTEDLPIPPATIAEPEKPAEVIPEPEKPAEEKPAEKLTEQQAVDAYLEVRKGEKDRKRKGTSQARIDELIKEKSELEKKNEELAKAAEAVKVAEPPKVEAPKPAEPPKTRPSMNEFEDVDEYHAAMALWAVEERARTAAAVNPPPRATPKEPEHLNVRKEEFDKFLEKGKRFVEGHPDFNATLEAAHIRGLTMSEAARIAITRQAAPEVAYWLAKPENDLAARALMGMDDLQQVIEVGRIAERLHVSPADFVSNAPPPGLRLTNGNTRSTVPLSELDTDDYIRARKQERRSARGR